jgi:hypothetical protein
MIEVVRSPDLELVWPAPSFTLATLFFLARETTLAMARSLDEIVRLDRRWFWAHPKRRHRCRWPDTGELDLLRSDRGARLIMAIRHLERGHVVYQPVIFQGTLPADEESAAALFALAATCPEPVPVLAMSGIERMLPSVRRTDEGNHAG